MTSIPIILKVESLKAVMDELSVKVQKFNQQFENYKNQCPQSIPGIPKELVWMKHPN
jgi:hypothetical protein